MHKHPTLSPSATAVGRRCGNWPSFGSLPVTTAMERTKGGDFMLEVKKVEKKVTTAASCHAPSCNAPACHGPA
jgi:hypothetical protein